MAIYGGKKLRKAFCWKCNCFHSATFAIGGLRRWDGLSVENVLRATCDVCDSVVASAPQAAPQIGLALEERERKTSFRVSHELTEMAQKAVAEAGLPGVTATRAVTMLVKAYLGSLVDNDLKRQSTVGKCVSLGAFPKGKSEETVSIRAHSAFFHQLEQLAVESHLPTPSDVFRCLVVLAVTDKAAGLELKKLVTIYA